MCGICGVAGNNIRAEVKEETVERMLEKFVYRGPDDKGILKEEGAFLGVRRLKIIDLQNGRQPMTNEDSSIWIVFNGEIYNFPELRIELEKKGHIFKSHADTEVILHLYEEDGFEFLKRLSGMFAFALWDKKQSILILARDRFGIKPLYYTLIKDKLLFASELKSLLVYPGIKKEIDPCALDAYLSLDYVPSPQCIFKDIYKLPPAHFLVYQGGKMRLEKYWELRPRTPCLAVEESEVKEKLMYLLRKSIKRHSISDVPLGVFLSGGIDSSTIVAISREIFPDTLKTFSIGFEEDSFDESVYANEVSGFFSTEHNRMSFGSDDVFAALPAVTRMLDEPFADASVFPTYILSKFSKKHITVALAGDGGDEVFSGYPTYQAHRLAGYYANIPWPLRKVFIESIARRLPVSHRNFSFDFMAKKFISAADISDPLTRHIRWMGAFAEDERESLYSDWLKMRVNRGNDNALVRRFASEGDRDLLTLVQKFDIGTYLEGDILVKTDRASMMNSQEVRVPYLDHELVEYVFSLPPELRMKNLRTKYIFKESLRGVVPKRVINRRKKGFGMPVSFWIKKQLKDCVFDTLNAGDIKKEGLFNYQYIERLLSEHLNNKRDNRKRIWSLFVFELWYKNYAE